MGSHIVDEGNTLNKIRRNFQKGPIDYTMPPDGKDAIGRAQIAFDNNEGCILRGYIQVNRVPGNFHISSHSYGEIINTLKKNINLTHTINHLSFGQRANVNRAVKKSKGRYGEFTPLNGHSEFSEQLGKTTNYQIDIIPSTFKAVALTSPSYIQRWTGVRANQYKFAVGSEYVGKEVVYFRYQIEGVTINYYQTADSILEFAINI
mmetsp:Transcript_31670/g.36148  ORF Transcript_31670/g.36148 Transcript_31670/m.36148 type:complete len:205 (+) Transcript_31670:276-890(+)